MAEGIPEVPVKALTDPKLFVEYTPSTDTLVLSGVGRVLRSYGDTVAQNLVAFTNEKGDEVLGVVIEHAAETLLPYLQLQRAAPVGELVRND